MWRVPHGAALVWLASLGRGCARIGPWCAHAATLMHPLISTSAQTSPANQDAPVPAYGGHTTTAA
jgi:hypothetical protein